MSKATCTKPDCVKPVKARGLCTTHYFRARRSGDLVSIHSDEDRAKWHILSDVDWEARTGVCSVCGPTAVSVRAGKGKLRSECMTQRRAHRATENSKYTPEAGRAQLLRRFGVTQEWYDATFRAQGNACAACGGTEHNGNNWHIDHDHSCCPRKGRSCGKCVRGILCHFCNTGLGCARDDMEILVKMIDYLHKYQAAA